MIYVVAERDVPDGAVKIGYTHGAPSPQRVLDRLNQLQTANPRVLVVIAMAAGVEADELALHDKFRASHVLGEWFSRSPDVVAFIDAHRCEPVASTACRQPPDCPPLVRRPPIVHLLQNDSISVAHCNAQVTRRHSSAVATLAAFEQSERPCRECARMRLMRLADERAA